MKKRTKKKYKLRPFGIAWWVVYGGGTITAVAGAYCWVCLLASMPVGAL